MTAVELLRELEERDAYLVAEGDQLSLDAPQGSVPPDLVAELRGQRETLREVLWRVEAMRPQVPATGAIPLLVARYKPVGVGRCVSCGDAVPSDNPGRCGLCVTAAVWVLHRPGGPPWSGS